MSEDVETKARPKRAVAELVDGEGQPLRRRVNWKWIGLLAARLVMDVALVDVGVETWACGSPARLWVTGPIAVYIALTGVALFAGARLAAPGIITQTPAAFYVLLAILGAITQDPKGLTTGFTFLKQPLPVVLVAAAARVSGLAALRFVTQRGTPWWLRAMFAAIGVYTVGALGLGAMRATPFHDLLSGHGEWARLPGVLQGAYIGAVLLTPLAFARELIVSMQVLRLQGHLRWMVVFGLGAWIAMNGM
jgi:hypothetical protein